MRVAVCGAGFIGRNLISRLIADGSRVNVLDRNARPADLDRKVNWIEGDFSDPAAVRKTLQGADVAYHLISATVPGDEHVDLVKELSENIVATLHFIDVCLECGVQRIVFVSSSSVYGLQKRMPIAEDASTNPISSHGIHKLTIEKYLLLYAFNHRIDVRIIRLSNPFGPGQDLRGRQGFVSIAIGKLLDDEPLLLRGGGSPTRDFIFIDDVGRALSLAGQVEQAPSVLNIGTGHGLTLAEAVSEIESLSGRKFELLGGDLRPVDIPVSVLDCTLARTALGFTPAISFRDGLRSTLEHYGIPVVAKAK
jgi:UDP-glucose 4-epimerase